MTNQEEAAVSARVDGQQKDAQQKKGASDAQSKTIVFAVVTTLLLFALMLIFTLFVRLDVFSASPHIAFALFLGVFFTIIVGVGLMALVFHSDRSGHDQSVAQASRHD